MKEIIDAISVAAARIKKVIEFGDTGYSEHVNKTGDTQLKLDIASDLIIEEEFKKVSSIKSIISEEKEESKLLHENGSYIIGYDPLDGSSLVDVNLAVGSIFGIYKNGTEGSDIVGAAYVVYGPRTEIVVAKDDVRLYRLSENGEFREIKTIKLNRKGKLNATGATQKGWSAYHKKLIDEIFADGYRLRYSGGMVPDLHQILLKGGGLFSYPATTDTPKGKLRLVFEVFPFAFVFEKAFGAAIDGKKRILELKPSHIHDTSPCFFGSNEEIKRVLDEYAKH
ncbi:MAG: class 1 fructose-bisphosphatase [Campylobacteraceae bacterium]|jgi:fructose-1,6-bisphosphatase I|nr:class 1 fructose-bisphosphatase [Campylobacteraceae bacterium]